MTSPSDIAGLSERLRSNPHGLTKIDTRAGINEPTDMIREAATALDSLTAENVRLTKRLDLLAAGFGVPDGGKYLEDWQARIKQYQSLTARVKELEEDAEALTIAANLQRTRAETAESRALRAEQQRDEAYDDLRSLWGADQAAIRICEHCDAWMTVEESARVDDVSLCPKEAYGSVKFPNEKCFKHRAWLIKEEQAAIRRLASGPEGGSALTAASDGEVG